MNEKQPSGLELIECRLEPVAREVAGKLYEARLPFTADHAMDAIELYWETAACHGDVPYVSIYEAVPPAVLAHLVDHVRQVTASWN